MKSKLKLHGFNNLTKTLSFNIYDICYAETPEDLQAYVQYIDEEYDAERLTQILTDVVDIIGANILNIARQDYDPQGASVTILISEQPVTPTDSQIEESPGPLPDTILAHLDKSHITVHTYPEIHPVDGIATFRVDIDVSTCGVISPLKALNYLIHQFDSDIVTVDYRVRGFTRDIEGRKPHAQLHRCREAQAAGGQGVARMLFLVDTHLLEDGTGFPILLGNLRQVFVQMLAHLVFGGGDEAQADPVAD